MNGEASTFGRAWDAVFQRPSGIAEGTRWLFVWLAIATVVLTLPGVFLTSRGGLLALGLGAALALCSSLVYGYLSKRPHPLLDVVDSVGILGLALSSPEAEAAVMVMIGSLWFRSLYGTLAQALVRGTLYALALGSNFLLWQPFRGSPVSTELITYLGLLPIIFLSVVIVRILGSTLVARDRSIARDRILAESGTRMLGAVETDSIMVLATKAADEYCAVTPGLRLIWVTRAGEVLWVEGMAGAFGIRSQTLPGTVISVPSGRLPARIVDPAPLDAAAGTPLVWVCLSFDERSSEGWLIVGSPKAVPDDAILSIRGLLTQIVLSQRNSDVRRELTRQARTDSLTGIDNRASFTARLAADLADPERRATLSVLFVDLDDFKDVNDGFGHLAGDRLLVGIAERLREGTRAGDVCARLGGDEFAVMVHDSGEFPAVELAERLVGALAEPFNFEGLTPIRVGASIGIARAASAIDLEDLVHQADVAMYAAKALGKGRVEVFGPELLAADRRRPPLRD